MMAEVNGCLFPEEIIWCVNNVDTDVSQRLGMLSNHKLLLEHRNMQTLSDVKNPLRSIVGVRLSVKNYTTQTPQNALRC